MSGDGLVTIAVAHLHPVEPLALRVTLAGRI